LGGDSVITPRQGGGTVVLWHAPIPKADGTNGG
jgi:hypothetical protein